MDAKVWCTSRETGSRGRVPTLREAGYEVEYHEFDGPHTLPAEMAEASVRWLTGGQ